MSYNFENIWVGRSDFSTTHNDYNGNPTATSTSSIYDVKVLRKALTEIEIDKMYTNIDIITESKIFYKLNGAVTVSDNNGTLSNLDYLFGTSNSIPNDSLYSLGKADNDGSIEFKITSTSECIIGISDKIPIIGRGILLGLIRLILVLLMRTNTPIRLLTAGV